MPTYNNAYNFSTTTGKGFQATIQVLDNLKNPVNIADFSAQMVLLTVGGQQKEFAWSTNDFISKSGAGNLVINVPSSNLMPQSYISTPDQYSYQVYNYTFTVLDGTGANYFTITGTVTIYII